VLNILVSSSAIGLLKYSVCWLNIFYFSANIAAKYKNLSGQYFIYFKLTNLFSQNYIIFLYIDIDIQLQLCIKLAELIRGHEIIFSNKKKPSYNSSVSTLRDYIYSVLFRW
jgi:hypothetical protein